LIDEATSNVDETSEKIVQQCIEESFSECTVLTIAHRIKTIMNCTKIMVLDLGEIVRIFIVSIHII